MEILLITLKSIYGAFFVFAGVMHIIKPTLFKHFIPNGFPKLLVNYVVGIIEFGLGATLFIPQFTSIAALGILVLLALLLPIHIWDLSKERPAIGSKKLALIRVPLQFILMYGAYVIYTNT